MPEKKTESNRLPGYRPSAQNDEGASGEQEFHIACAECGEELKPGDAAIAATTGTIASDGGFYMEVSEPWLWVRHAPDCTESLT